MTLPHATLIAIASLAASLIASLLFAVLGAAGARAESFPQPSTASATPLVEQEVAAASDAVPLAAGVSDHALGFHMSPEPALTAALAMLGCVLGWASTRRRVLRRGGYGK